MSDAFIRAIAQSDSQGRFLSDENLKTIRERYSEASSSLDAAEWLTQNREHLSEVAAQVIARRRGANERYAENINYFLRLVTYSLVAGGTGPIAEGLDEVTRSLAAPRSSYVEALKQIKELHGLTGQPANELNRYIDYIISAIS